MNHSQAISSLLTFIATLLLLYVTYDYANTARMMAEATSRVYLHYWLEQSAENLPLRFGHISVANLSANAVFVNKYVVRLNSEFDMFDPTIIPTGEVRNLSFPVAQLAGKSGEVLVAIKLCYVSGGLEGETEFRLFRLEIINHQVAAINEGPRPA